MNRWQKYWSGSAASSTPVEIGRGALSPGPNEGGDEGPAETARDDETAPEATPTPPPAPASDRRAATERSQSQATSPGENDRAALEASLEDAYGRAWPNGDGGLGRVYDLEAALARLDVRSAAAALPPRAPAGAWASILASPAAARLAPADRFELERTRDIAAAAEAAEAALDAVSPRRDRAASEGSHGRGAPMDSRGASPVAPFDSEAGGLLRKAAALTDVLSRGAALGLEAPEVAALAGRRARLIDDARRASDAAYSDAERGSPARGSGGAAEEASEASSVRSRIAAAAGAADANTTTALLFEAELWAALAAEAGAAGLEEADAVRDRAAVAAARAAALASLGRAMDGPPADLATAVAAANRAVPDHPLARVASAKAAKVVDDALRKAEDAEAGASAAAPDLRRRAAHWNALRTAAADANLPADAVEHARRRRESLVRRAATAEAVDAAVAAGDAGALERAVDAASPSPAAERGSREAARLRCADRLRDLANDDGGASASAMADALREAEALGLPRAATALLEDRYHAAIAAGLGRDAARRAARGVGPDAAPEAHDAAIAAAEDAGLSYAEVADLRSRRAGAVARMALYKALASDDLGELIAAVDEASTAQLGPIGLDVFARASQRVVEKKRADAPREAPAPAAAPEAAALRASVAARLQAATSLEDLLAAVALAERTGHPVDEPAYVAARHSLGNTVLCSGPLAVSRSALGEPPRDSGSGGDEVLFFALTAAVFDPRQLAYLGPALHCAAARGGGEFLLDGARIARGDGSETFAVAAAGAPRLALAAESPASADRWTAALTSALCRHHAFLASTDDGDPPRFHARRSLLSAARGAPRSLSPGPRGGGGGATLSHAALAAEYRAGGGGEDDDDGGGGAVLGCRALSEGSATAEAALAAVVDADAVDLHGLVVAIDRARAGGIALVSPAYKRACAKGERLLARKTARGEIALAKSCADVDALLRTLERAEAAGLADDEIETLRLRIQVLVAAQGTGTPRSGNRDAYSPPPPPSKSPVDWARRFRDALAGALRRPASAAAVADALVAATKAGAWRLLSPLIAKVDALPPARSGPLAVRSDAGWESNCADARLRPLTFSGGYPAGPALLLYGDALQLGGYAAEATFDLPAGAAAAGAGRHALVLTHPRRPRLTLICASAADRDAWNDEVRFALLDHADLKLRLAAACKKRTVVDRANVGHVRKSLFPDDENDRGKGPR